MVLLPTADGELEGWVDGGMNAVTLRGGLPRGRPLALIRGARRGAARVTLPGRPLGLPRGLPLGLLGPGLD